MYFLTHIYTNTHYIYVCVCMCVCMCACVGVCMCVYVFECVCVSVCIVPNNQYIIPSNFIRFKSIVNTSMQVRRSYAVGLCTAYIVHYTSPYTVHCTAYNVRTSLHAVQCTIIISVQTFALFRVPNFIMRSRV